MIETKPKSDDTGPQEMADVVAYENQVNELHENHPVLKRLEDYVSQKNEKSYSDSKSQSRKARSLAFQASKIRGDFIELIRPNQRSRFRNAQLSPRNELYEDDPLKIKLEELGLFFTKRYDTLMDEDPFLIYDESLSEDDNRQKELVIRYTRGENVLCSGMRTSENRQGNYRGRFIEVGEKLPPSEANKEYYTFRRIFDNFRTGISNKVIRRELTEEDYNYVVNTPTEKIFYDLTERAGLPLKD
tara:strand:+ start:4756 stop:5487 length:732 start_codon:yes stop_codon:yes gene_type:complete